MATVEEVGAGPSPALVDAVRAIYEDSFPPEERADPDELVSAGQLFVARRDGEVAAFAQAVPLDVDGMYLLAYLAVARADRDAGVGGELLDEVVGRLRGSVLLIEVEHPDEGDTVERARRVSFYMRHGARPVECAPGYRAPRLDGPGSLAYLLMWAPLAPGAEEPAGDRLRAAVEAIFTRSYQLSADDPLVAEVIGGLTC